VSLRGFGSGRAARIARALRRDPYAPPRIGHDREGAATVDCAADGFDFSAALRAHGEPTEIVTDRAPALRAAIEGLMPAASHTTEQCANNRVECDHGRLKARLRPMRGLKCDHTARVIIRGHALMQNIRRGHYELGIDTRPHRRIEHAFNEAARTT
jgi:IS6 family transposase